MDEGEQLPKFFREYPATDYTIIAT